MKGEVVAVGVGEGEAAHVVLGGYGLFEDSNGAGKELVEGGVHVGAAEEERGVGVGGEAGCVGRGRAFAFVVSGVEHDGGAAAAQHAPMDQVKLPTSPQGDVAETT